MSTTLLLTTIAFASVGGFVETKFLKDLVPFMYEAAPAFPAVTRGFGLVVLVLTGFSFWLTIFGFKVGNARKACRELAEKDGESDPDKYDLPNLYAYGPSKHAVAFNQVQRAHQHALETITQMYMATIFASMVFPLTAATGAFLWAYGRVCWSTAYAEQGRDLRYSHPMAIWIWRGYLANIMLSLAVFVTLVFGSA